PRRRSVRTPPRSRILPPADNPYARSRPRRPKPSAARRTESGALARLARRRLTTCAACVLLVFSVLTTRLVQPQAGSGRHYEQLALKQRLNTVTIPADRGTIFDRNGNDLALTVQAPTVWANPQVVGDPNYYASKLAPVVGVSEQVLAQRLSQHKLQFV